jgi:ABC-type multidrug transport system fused ATPase/permease subunit
VLRGSTGTPRVTNINLSDIVKEFRKGIIFAMSLVVVEHVAWIVEPTLFGNLIDATINTLKGTPGASYVLPLSLWVGAFLLNSGVGTARRSVDQRIYLNMFTEIATRVSHAALERRLSVSQTAARAQLSREFITFFQYRVPEIGEQAIAIGGALIGLMFFDYRIAVSCLFVIAPLLIVHRFYNRTVVSLQQTVHDSVEETYEVFATKSPEKVREYFTALARPQQRIADWGALSFGLLRIVLLGIFLVVLYISLDLDAFTTGAIYSIVAYLWTFVTSSEYLPELLESWTSLKDITRRLRSESV